MSKATEIKKLVDEQESRICEANSRADRNSRDAKAYRRLMDRISADILPAWRIDSYKSPADFAHVIEFRPDVSLRRLASRELLEFNRDDFKALAQTMGEHISKAIQELLVKAIYL